ncbi:MAG: PA14 domain-containing protein, partial [Actinomycetota bacterium]
MDGAAKSGVQHPTIPFTSVGADLASYSSVFPSTDLHYQVGAGSVTERMVLNAVPSVKNSSYSWTVTAKGLTPIRTTANDLDFVATNGTVEFVIPAFTMWDSSKDAAREPVPYAVTKLTASTWRITLSPSRSWLAGEKRVYPVTIDPDVLEGGLYESSSYSVNSAGTSVPGGRIGGTSHWYANITYDLRAIAGKQLTYAKYEIQALPGSSYGCPIGATVDDPSGVEMFNGLYCEYDPGSYNHEEAVNDEPTLQYDFARWAAQSVQSAQLYVYGSGYPYSIEYITTAVAVEYKDFPTVTGVTSATPTNGAKAPDMPILQATGTDPNATGLHFKYEFSTDPTFSSIAWASPFAPDGPYQVPKTHLLPGTKYYYRITAGDDYDGVLGVGTRPPATNSAWYFVTNTPAPTPDTSAVSPGKGQVVTSLTPTFSSPTVTDTDSTVAVQYNFRVATGTDGKSGSVTTSGWLPAPASGPVTWTPPIGSLQDGGSYTLAVLTSDGVDTNYDPTDVNHFTVNLRIGTPGPAPTDAAGPVTVNLANGNANLSFTSPTVSTIGGPMGMSFVYNSLQAGNQFEGLTGSYFNALTPGQASTTTFDLTGKTPVLVRTDPNVSFDWSAASPAPSVPSTYFMAKWTGFVQVPATGGPFTFGLQHDDGAVLSVGGSKVIDQWSSVVPTTQWATSTTASGSGQLPFELDYNQSTGTGYVQLWVKDASGTTKIVPSSWFTTRFQSLPAGWSASSALTGDAGNYVSAQLSDGSVALTDVSGTVHTYTKTSAGGYTAPAGEYGVLALSSAGLVTLTDDDGTVYSFTAQGKVATVTPATDSKKAATPVATYRPGTGQVDVITDPLSAAAAQKRQVVFAYSGDTAVAVGLGNGDTDGNNAQSSGSACSVPAGFDQPPVGMLCRIIYPGHVEGAADTTELLYSSGQLAEILDPGYEASSFGYDSNGRLSRIRNSLANDWLVAPNTSRTPSDANAATITYTDAGLVNTVSLPAPDGTTMSLRPQKTYNYGSGSTTVDVAGQSGHAKTVTFDSAMRQLTATSAMGVTGSQVWSNKDQLLSATDAVGHETTTIYDPRTDRPTDTYGPAPAACFGADRTPLASCPILPAHSHTGYDSGLVGLNAAYYNTPDLGGAPTQFSLGLAPVTGATVATDGSVNADWGV